MPIEKCDEVQIRLSGYTKRKANWIRDKSVDIVRDNVTRD